MALGRTSAGFRKFRAVRPGSRVALVAPSSPFSTDAFEAGCRELVRLGLQPVYDERVFAREATVAGPADVRAAALADAWTQDAVDVVMAVRGGYGSMELLPRLDRDAIAERPMPFVGYSDTTALHSWINGHLGMASVHGAMIDGRLSVGESAYDVSSFLACLGVEPLGELAPDGLETIVAGEATGTLVGGTLTQLCASLGTPFDFRPPPGSIVFIDEVGERPYRLRRMLEQLRQSGRFAGVSALVFGQLPSCDEPTGKLTARAVVEEFVGAMGVPVMIGFPSGHTVTPLISVPFGVRARVVARAHARLICDEAAAE